MQLAVNKARLDAAQNLAGQVSSEMNGLVKRAQEETGLGADSDLIDRFSQTQEQVIATSLKDWRVSEKEIQEEKSNNQRIYRAYVLIEWDEGAANKRLLQRLRKCKEPMQRQRLFGLIQLLKNTSVVTIKVRLLII